MTARDRAAAVIAAALDVTTIHPAVPIDMAERIADALVAEGLIGEGETRVEKQVRPVWAERPRTARDAGLVEDEPTKPP